MSHAQSGARNDRRMIGTLCSHIKGSGGGGATQALLTHGGSQDAAPNAAGRTSVRAAVAAAGRRRPRVAAIVTAYFPQSHADVVVSKLITGYSTDDGFVEPSVDVVALYIDQVVLPAFDNDVPLERQTEILTTPGGRNPADIGLAIAAAHGIPVFSTIPRTLYEGDHRYAEDGSTCLDIDGVVMIGEHGDYPKDELGRSLYPQRYFFEQIAGVFAQAGRSVPVFSDKHLSYCIDDAVWMMKRAERLDIPLLAGSSLATCWRRPNLEYDLGEHELTEACCLCNGGVTFGFGGDGWHAMEGVQAMLERRKGGECGVAEVRYLEGDAVWKSRDKGEWASELMEMARSYTTTRSIPLEEVAGVGKDGDSKPGLILIKYRDGLRFSMLLIPNVIVPDTAREAQSGYDGAGGHCAYAARTTAGETHGCEFFLQPDATHGHFSYLTANIEQMFLTGQPPYDAHRTLLTTGIFDYVMVARGEGTGAPLTTPDLDISYTSYPDDARPCRPHLPRPVGACVDITNPDDNWTKGGGRWATSKGGGRWA